MKIRPLICALFGLALLPSWTGAQSAAAPAASLSTTDPAAGGTHVRAAEIVREFVRAELARTQPRLRAEISVGDIDSRLRLAACERTEAYLRPGAKLWGHSFVAYRCLQRPGWSISVPVNVRLFETALVALRPVAALQPVDAADVELRDTEVTAEPGGVAHDLSELADRVCTRGLQAGQAIALSALRMVPAVSQGEPVKVEGSGSGFTITAEGIAMSTAAPGELVRVRMESGRTIAGVARKGRLVEVSF